MALHQRHFKTLIDLVQYSENNHKNDGPDSIRRSIMDHGKDWNGVNTKAEAYALMCKGWPDGLAKMKAIMAKVYNVIHFDCPEYQFHDSLEGCAPNIENYLHGIPEDMHAMEPIVASVMPSFLTVQCEMSMSCWATPEQAMWAGACVFAAVELLKAQGCAVSILMSHSIHGNNGDFWQSMFPIPNDLDMDTISFLFTHPAMLRTVILSAMEHEPSDLRTELGFQIPDGYGRPAKVKLVAADAHIAMQTLVLNFGQGDIPDTAQAQKFVNYLVATKFATFAPITTVEMITHYETW